jgi:hypothetical protein
VSLTKEQQEVAIWGGGALVLVLVLWYVVAGLRAGAVEQDGEAANLHKTYEVLFADGPDRTPIAQARSAIGNAVDNQAAERLAAEGAVLGEVPRGFVDDLERLNIGFTVTRLNEVHQSLRSKAQRLNVGRLPTLPYEEDGGLEADSPLSRSKKLVEADFYGTVLDFLIDRNASAVTSVTAEPIGADNARAPAYVRLGVRVSFQVDYPSLDRILGDLRSGESALSLREITISRSGEDIFETELVATRLASWPGTWDTSLLSNAGSTGSGATSGARGSGRGSTRGR